MLISLKQDEIETALQNYIGETAVGLDLTAYDVNIKLIAGRSGNGLRAEIELAPLGSVKAEVATENDADPSAAEAKEEESAEQVVEPFDFDND